MSDITASEDFDNRQVAVIFATRNRREEQCRCHCEPDWNNGDSRPATPGWNLETKAAHR